MKSKNLDLEDRLIALFAETNHQRWAFQEALDISRDLVLEFSEMTHDVKELQIEFARTTARAESMKKEFEALSADFA